MKQFFTLSLFLTFAMFGCQKDKAIGSTEILGTWKLMEEKMGSGIIVGEPTDYVTVQSNKTITFFDDGSYESNGDMCEISIHSDFSTQGIFNETAHELEPSQCYSPAASSGIVYSIESGYLIISYKACIEGCEQKYKLL